MKNEKLLFGLILAGILLALFVEINFPDMASAAIKYKDIGIYVLLGFLTYKVVFKKR